MSSCEQDFAPDGLGKICMRNDELRVSIMPDAGGKISELTDLVSGRNWLWSNPNIPFELAQYNADYGRVLDSGGWDEILMSLSAVALKLGDDSICTIPDHGDLVGQVWAVTRAEAEPGGDVVCEMTVTGRAAYYRITRTIRLRAGSRRLEISYSLLNRDTTAWPWYWSAHALLAAEPDMRINLPAEDTFRVENFSARVDYVDRIKRHWPKLDLKCGKALDLSRSFQSTIEKDRFAGKIFVRSPESNSVEIVIDNTNERLSLHYDPEELPWLGLWINNKGWSGNGAEPYCNLGLEPATTPYDNVVEAIGNNAVPWLQPGETRRWSLALELHS